MHKSQKGYSSILVIILAVLIVFAVGATAFLSIDKNNQQKNQADNNNAQSAATQAQNDNQQNYDSSGAKSQSNTTDDTDEFKDLAEKERNAFWVKRGGTAIIPSLEVLDAEKPSFVPSDYITFNSINFNFSTTEFINVYYRCSASYCKDDSDLIVTKYNSKDKSSIIIGKIHIVSGANAGGLFVPVAITKDNKKLILRAVMGSPGAGGGETDYGYALVSIPGQESESEMIDKNYDSIGTPSAIFYDYSSKVIYVENGGKIPEFSKPGPSNDGQIVSINLISETKEVVLAEDYTSYRIKNIDESGNIMNFEATRYTIPSGCSVVDKYGEWTAYSYDSLDSCVIKTTTSRSMTLSNN